MFFWQIKIVQSPSGIPVKYVAVNTVFISPHELLVNSAEEIRKLAGSKKCKTKAHDQLYVMNSKDDMALEALQVGGSGKLDRDGVMILFAIKSDSLIDSSQDVKVDDEALFLIANELLFDEDVDLFTESQKQLIEDV